MSSTTIRQFTSNLLIELNELYPEHEIRQFSKLMLQHVLKVSHTYLLIMGNDELSNDQMESLQEITTQLKQHKPLQYCIGSTEFYGLEFKVTESVLIPRPETEELVDWILKGNLKADSLLDIGTGSGCIALSLKAHMPQTNITAWDISTDALTIAKTNATSLKLNVSFEEVDVLNYKVDDRKFDCIVSNPPYVRELEKALMQSNVLDYEPNTALFVSDSDPLIFYRTIAQLGKKILTKDGTLYFEINEYLACEMTEMLTLLGYCNIECRKDINSRDRMMKAKLTS